MKKVLSGFLGKEEINKRTYVRFCLVQSNNMLQKNEEKCDSDTIV